MNTSDAKILGVAAQEVVFELEANLLLEVKSEFLHPVRKIYDVETQAFVECFAAEGFILFQGRIVEDIYYVGLLDGLVYCQAVEKGFTGFRKEPSAKKGMSCKGIGSISPVHVINHIANNILLEQKMIITINITACQEAIVPRSMVVTSPLEHPVYRVMSPEFIPDGINGPELKSDYPDLMPDDPSAILAPEAVSPDLQGETANLHLRSR